MGKVKEGRHPQVFPSILSLKHTVYYAIRSTLHFTAKFRNSPRIINKEKTALLPTKNCSWSYAVIYFFVFNPLIETGLGKNEGLGTVVFDFPVVFDCL